MDALQTLFDTSGFPPRWHCGVWSAPHGWTHIISDLAIFGAYVTIPCLLAFFALRRKDVPFLPIFWLFGAFILSCGLGHLVEATIFWNPWYRFSGAIKVCTAVVSWLTVFALIPVLPRALGLPRLAKENAGLHREVTERKAAEAQLQEQTSALRESHEELERFVGYLTDREERVADLKSEINTLLVETGRSPKYETVSS